MPYFCPFPNCFYRTNTKTGISAHGRTCKYKNSSTTSSYHGNELEKSGAIGEGIFSSINEGNDNAEININSAEGNLNDESPEKSCNHTGTEDSALIEGSDMVATFNNDVETTFNDNSSSESDMRRVVETIAVNLCIVERKVGKKIVEEIIKAVNNVDFNKEMFNSQIKTFHDCKMTCRNLVRKSFNEEGFSETVVTDGEGKLQAKFFKRNVLNLLRTQLKNANAQNFYLHPVEKLNSDGEVIFQHPLETAYARNVQRKVMDRVMASSDPEDIWYYEGASETESFVGMFQLYSDKSALTMKKSGITAYPVHIVFLNFKYEAWKKAILDNETIVAYLPVSYEIEDNVWRVDNGNVHGPAVDRSSKLKILHNAYEIILEDLNDIVNRGFQGVMETGKIVRCHPLIMEIASDIPEGKDLSSVLHGNRTNYPCTRCLCPFFLLNTSQKFKARTTQQTEDIRRRAIENDETSRRKDDSVTGKTNDNTDILKCNSLKNVKSYFEVSNLFLHDSNSNIYRTLGFECMHNLDLGVSKELKECIFNMLGSQEKLLKGVEKEGTSYRHVKNSLLRAVNSCLRDIQTESSVNGMNVDFSSNDSGAGLNGLFTSKGVTGMMEAKDWRAIDHVFPFAVSIIDRLCEKEWAPLTSIAVMYIDIIQMTAERDSDQHWTESELKRLKLYVKHFQDLVRNYLGDYQKSKFNTLKFHFLNHIADDVRDFGDLRMLEVRFYENRHIHYRTAWERTSKRKDSEFRETIKRIEDTVVLERARRNIEEEKETIPYGNLQCGLVQKGQVMKVSELRMMLNYIRASVKDVEDSIPKKTLEELKNKFTCVSTVVLKQVGDQGGMALLNLLREEVHYDEDKAGNYLEHVEKIRVVKSGYVKGGYSCGRDDINPSTGEIKTIRMKRNVWQRYVACSDYHNTGKPRYSFVIMENGIKSASTKQKYAIAQIRCLFWHEVDGQMKQFAFVKYMEAVRPIDVFEETLGCAIFRWSTDDEIDYTVQVELGNDEKPPSGWFDVVEVSRIKSVVQMIRLRRKLQLTDTDQHWSKQRYALNRFVVVEMWKR